MAHSAPVDDTFTNGVSKGIFGGRKGRPSWVMNMKPLTWKLVGNALSDVYSDSDPNVNPKYPATAPWATTGNLDRIVGAWSGAGCFGTRVTLNGGGHGDSANNGLYTLDLNSENPSWTVERYPTGSKQQPWDGVNNDNLPNSIIVDWCIPQESGANVDVYPDGSPISAHTYGNVLAIGNYIYMNQGYRAGGGSGGKHLFRYDRTAKTWTQLAQFPGSIGGFYTGWMVWDPLRNRIVQNTTSVVGYYYPDTDTWQMANHSYDNGYDTFNMYIPHLDCIATFPGHPNCGYKAMRVWDFERTPPASYINIKNPVTSGDVGVLANRAGVYVQRWKKILIWESGANFITVDPPAANPMTDTWTFGTLNADASNSVTPSPPKTNGTYGRFFHMEELGIVGVINSVNEKTYVFRLW